MSLPTQKKSAFLFTFTKSSMITNNSLILTQTLEFFTPKLNGWKLNVLVGSASVIALIAIMIQSAVYRSLKSLGSRHINQMIIPSLVKFSFNFYLLLYVFNSWLKKILVNTIVLRPCVVMEFQVRGYKIRKMFAK